MKNITVGILAHVDAGKTTLSEGLLYTSGALRKLGRVDHGDAFLDTESLERERGITIFSKQAILTVGDTVLTLLDTPGHADFSAEMERTLPVLDYAILVISGTDGVQSHTRTLWRLLETYRVPVFLFVNKIDLAGAERGTLMAEVQKKLSSNCIDFTAAHDEAVAMCDEAALEDKDNYLYAHRCMIKELLSAGGAKDEQEAEKRVTDKVNDVCRNILLNTAVFKKDENGVKGFDGFLASVGIERK